MINIHNRRESMTNPPVYAIDNEQARGKRKVPDGIVPKALESIVLDGTGALSITDIVIMPYYQTPESMWRYRGEVELSEHFILGLCGDATHLAYAKKGDMHCLSWSHNNFADLWDSLYAAIPIEQAIKDVITRAAAMHSAELGLAMSDWNANDLVLVRKRESGLYFVSTKYDMTGFDERIPLQLMPDRESPYLAVMEYLYSVLTGKLLEGAVPKTAAGNNIIDDVFIRDGVCCLSYKFEVDEKEDPVAYKLRGCMNAVRDARINSIRRAYEEDPSPENIAMLKRMELDVGVKSGNMTAQQIAQAIDEIDELCANLPISSAMEREVNLPLMQLAQYRGYVPENLAIKAGDDGFFYATYADSEGELYVCKNDAPISYTGFWKVYVEARRHLRNVGRNVTGVIVYRTEG